MSIKQRLGNHAAVVVAATVGFAIGGMGLVAASQSSGLFDDSTPSSADVTTPNSTDDSAVSVPISTPSSVDDTTNSTPSSVDDTTNSTPSSVDDSTPNSTP
ncbi:MAG: hypothetical protein HY826_14870, partial [Actinobacteria bacterium]|nr:hypothetical protein [Actinomycetota bacterium]